MNMINLLLQLRCDENMNFNNWLLTYLRERTEAVEKGVDRFDEDRFETDVVFRSELKLLKKYKDLLNKQKGSSLTDSELNKIKQMKSFLNLSKFADLPYPGMIINQHGEAPDKINEDLKIIRKSLVNLNLKNGDELKQTLKMFEDFFEKYKEQSDNLLYKGKGAKDFYEILKDKEYFPHEGSESLGGN